MSWVRTGRVLGLASLILGFAFLLGGCQPPKPEEARIALKLALESEKKGDDAAAMAQFAKAAQLDSRGPTAPEALVKWGALAMKMKKQDEAVKAYAMLKQQKGPAEVRVDGEVVRIPADVEALHDRAMQAQDLTRRGTITYRVMDLLVGLTGRHPLFSYWIAILLFTVVIKLILTPLTVSQLRNTRKMTLIQPRMKEIQDLYRDRPDEMNRRVMALYKEEGVNPLGCGGGMLLQMFIMFAFYRVILDYQYQFTQGQFLWIGSGLSGMFPSVVGTSLARPDMPLLIIYAISLFVQTKMTMTTPSMDPQQAQQQKMMSYMMPLMLLVVLQSFPSAFTLYWLLFNVLSTIQQLHINKQLDEEMKARREAGGGGGDDGDRAQLPPRPRPTLPSKTRPTAPPGGSKRQGSGARAPKQNRRR